jgi:hypothetical protein
MVLLLIVLLLLGGIGAMLLQQTPGGLGRFLAPGVASGPAGSTQTQAKEEPPDPELFELPPPNHRALARDKQAQLQQKAEATYLNPASSDAAHISAANTLLGLPEGYTSLIKGLDVYAGQSEYRRRYRWCLQYLLVVQHERDQARPPKPGQPSGIIPAKHVTGMVELLRRLDPAKPVERSQIATTLDYLEQHPEHAAPLASLLQELSGRYTGNEELTRALKSALAAIKKSS